MTDEDNPLDRISAGPAPTGPSPWRANRLPTGSPYASGGRSAAGRRRRLGRAGWITLIVAVALVAGAIGWAAVSKPSTVSPIGAPDDPAVLPAPPSLEQVMSNRVFDTAMVTPSGCALPAWSTEREAMQRFSEAATRCMETEWGLRPYRVQVFSAPDDVVPGSTCAPGWRIQSISSCGDTTFVNQDRLTAATGNQPGGALQWLALTVAGRAAGASGQNSDVDALVRVSGDTAGLGAEYLRRKHLQDLCMSGATVARLVGTAITPADRDQASTNSASWTVISRLGDAAVLSRTNTRGWFDRGSLSPTQAVCRTVWTVPVDQVS